MLHNRSRRVALQEEEVRGSSLFRFSRFSVHVYKTTTRKLEDDYDRVEANYNGPIKLDRKKRVRKLQLRYGKHKKKLFTSF
jgi:hypothetical protein